MIPKIINYCWFGKGKKPDKVLECIESWKKFCPDYKIIEWNENNCNININNWVKKSYKLKKWAFISDYFRLKTLYQNGGFYLDTDMELKSSLDFFLENKFFLGFDSRKILSGGIIGAEKGNTDLLNLITIYENKKFDGTTINSIITPYFEKKGLILNGEEQSINNIHFYKSNRISIDMNDGKSIVVDHHLNSWNDGKKVNHTARVYLEYLATKDPKIGEALDEIYSTYTSSYIWKIGTTIINLLNKLGLIKIISKILKYFNKL